MCTETFKNVLTTFHTSCPYNLNNCVLYQSFMFFFKGFQIIISSLLFLMPIVFNENIKVTDIMYI